MCGIAGIVDLTSARHGPSREALLRMAGALHHRGPDEFGIYRAPGAGLAHARLSIIDLSTGQQPLANEDGTLWIVFNGEIFNYVELRAVLERLGHRFRTRSDTEVIVHAYEAWGNDAFERMDGQWAVALWDEREQRLVLSRDRFGIAPLHLCVHRERLYFASEVKAIFAADASIPRAFDPLGLEQTFTFWTAVPRQSVFHGIEELRPGHVRVYQNGSVRETAYWTPCYHELSGGARRFNGTVDDAAFAVREALEQAVRLRTLRADVPVGSYLSGGLDSSLVAALGRRFAGSTFQTFSLRFTDAEYDETGFQRLMAGRLGSQHHEVTVTRSDIAAVFPQVVYHTERPILRTAPAPLFLLSRLVRRQGIKVVLTGEGADEMFAGYDVFREAKVRRFWARFPESRLRPRALERLYPYLARSPVSTQALARHFFGRNLADHQAPGFGHGPRWHTTGLLKRLFSDRMRHAVNGHDVIADFLCTLPEEFRCWSRLAQDQYIEIRTLLSGYLLSSQGDRMLMAHSIEGRFPFLDRDVVALADSLPAEYKLRVLDEKHVLKRTSRGLVPDEIVQRKKQPYRAPDALAFVGRNPPEYLEEMLDGKNVAEAGVFDPAAVARLWRKCKARANDGQFSNTDNMAVTGVLSTQLVYHHYIRHRPAFDSPAVLCTDIDHCQISTTYHASDTRRRTVAS
ncbi:MAG: asparagine synthase (glutamine-hydrolyzing) [Betaproteobacteria bacterium]|nr:asparagine synthase (glutamine-hydrolyzing) [Betaproteobacteria bacterium]